MSFGFLDPVSSLGSGRQAAQLMSLIYKSQSTFQWGLGRWVTSAMISSRFLLAVALWRFWLATQRLSAISALNKLGQRERIHFPRFRLVAILIFSQTLLNFLKRFSVDNGRPDGFDFLDGAVFVSQLFNPEIRFIFQKRLKSIDRKGFPAFFDLNVSSDSFSVSLGEGSDNKNYSTLRTREIESSLVRDSFDGRYFYEVTPPALKMSKTSKQGDEVLFVTLKFLDTFLQGANLERRFALILNAITPVLDLIALKLCAIRVRLYLSHKKNNFDSEWLFFLINPQANLKEKCDRALLLFAKSQSWCFCQTRSFANESSYPIHALQLLPESILFFSNVSGSK